MADKSARALLGSLAEIGEDGDLDQKARSVVSVLLNRVIAKGSSSKAASPAKPGECPNCGAPCRSLATPYCSTCCKERAAFVRQFRQAVHSGALEDQEKQMHKGEVLWRLLGGGLPRRVAAIPERARERVFKEAGGKCHACGAPATTIDNMGSG